MALIQTSDIHNHLLPGVDDGFRHAADSLQAIERMAAAGVSELVFTPHMNPDVYPDVTEVRHREVYEEFRRQIPAGLSLTTHLAAEYMVVKGFEERAASRADELHVFPDRSILVEMSYYYRSQNLEQTLFELNMAGLKPILAHPERYLYMADCLGDFDKIVGMGCRLQMNLMSLTGTYGKESIKILDHLLSHGMYSFMATDLHSLGQLDRILDFKPGFFLKRKLRKCFEL
ncbi:MAG: hypothetical protein KBT49_09065 [Bacteroidetes bacterium]|nr:hypothetical protein [Candidatus Colenecus caballi]